MANNAKIGLIGLGVMGENLALNIERNGFPVAIFNRHTDKVTSFIEGRGKGKQFIGCMDEKSFVAAIERPAKIVLLVKAGEATDETIAKIKPFLQKGDIIIDGGNSHFLDTRSRENKLSQEGIFLIGSGVSGGEEGALWGPSLMPGGNPKAYEEIRPVWEAIAAKADGQPCVTYIGPDGAGHFVKMVHNGIEYGDMQLIAEVYDILRRGLGFSADKISSIFTTWNTGYLNSFLIEITAKILSVKDPETGKPLVDLILDKAGQKGTGKWTAESAQELSVPIPTIDAALTARLMSSLKNERMTASLKYGQNNNNLYAGDANVLLKAIEVALYSSKICSYAQGMALIAAGSKFYNWNINLSKTAAIWRGGCIIRAQMLSHISKAFKKQPDLPNLLLDNELGSFVNTSQDSWRLAVTAALQLGIPVPAMSASLSYFDSYRTANLPQNLTQAQRDFFGAHTYERVDKPTLGPIHTDWIDLALEKPAKKS